MDYLVDVRTYAEFESGSHQNAYNLPVQSVSDIQILLPEIRKNDTLLLFCDTGARATLAEMMLRDMGYRRARNVGSLQEVLSMYNNQPYL